MDRRRRDGTRRHIMGEIAARWAASAMIDQRAEWTSSVLVAWPGLVWRLSCNVCVCVSSGCCSWSWTESDDAVACDSRHQFHSITTRCSLLPWQPIRVFFALHHCLCTVKPANTAQKFTAAAVCEKPFKISRAR